ncbi:MAG: 50S ribosomal protein L11 methyltransferase [Bacteroidota bacterium]
MDYIQVDFVINPIEGREICMAFLSQIPFETFQDTDSGLVAFIQEEFFEEQELKRTITEIEHFSLSYKWHKVERINWNDEWEKNFDPIYIDDQCIIRAPFHKPQGLEYEIIIMPKMSFGTGHHATTFLMMRYLLNEPPKAKRVLDAGCGTAVLAIMAEKLHASQVLAYDIDDWAVENSIENIAVNNCKKITVEKGDIKKIAGSPFDVILANINKNVLLHELEAYDQRLSSGGLLYLSGFYSSDIQEIENFCKDLGLSCIQRETKDEWAALKFLKMEHID